MQTANKIVLASENELYFVSLQWNVQTYNLPDYKTPFS